MITSAKIVSVGMNSEDYHKQSAARGTVEFVMSASALKLFDQCPSRFKAGYNPPESDAKDYGSLLDTRLLTPEQFNDRFAIKPKTYTSEKGEVKPWNGNSNTCKQWLEDNERFEIVTQSDVDDADTAIKRLLSDPVIAEIIEQSEKQVCLSGVWSDKATGLEIPLKGLVDLLPPMDSVFGAMVADLKTTRNAAVMPWQRWCFQCSYHLQAALYIDLLIAAGQERRDTFCFLLSENYAPYETGKRMLSQDFLNLGREAYKTMLHNYCQCMKSGKWPGYDDTDEAIQGFTLVAPEPFMAERAMFAPKFDFAGEFPYLHRTETPLADTPLCLE